MVEELKGIRAGKSIVSLSAQIGLQPHAARFTGSGN
jgi:hypothetical protein